MNGLIIYDKKTSIYIHNNYGLAFHDTSLFENINDL